MFNLVKVLGRLTTRIVAKALDGPDQGKYVEIGARYNTTLGVYELLTAGSGGSSTPVDTNNAIYEDDNNAVFEDGNNLIY